MKYIKEYKKYLTSVILDNANNSIFNTTFITAFALFIGLSDKNIGILTSITGIMMIVQLFAGSIFSKIGQSKKVVLANYTIYRLASILPIFIPFLTSSIEVRTILMFLFIIIYGITGQLGYITFVNWRMSLLKKEDRPKFYASKTFFKNTVVMLFSFLIGVILDYFQNNGMELQGFSIIFFLIFLIAFIDICIRIFTYKPKLKENKVKFTENFLKPLKDINFRKYINLNALYTFALTAGSMYLTLYIMKYLNVNYTFAFTLTIITALAEAFSSIIWKNIFNKSKCNWNLIIIPSLVFIILAFFILSYMGNGVVYLLPVIYFLLGIAYGGYGLFNDVAVYEAAKDNYKTSYITIFKAIAGFVTLLAPLLVSLIPETGDFIFNIKLTFILSTTSFIIAIVYYLKAFYMKNKQIKTII